jgi:hypothetical protein
MIYLFFIGLILVICVRLILNTDKTTAELNKEIDELEKKSTYISKLQKIIRLKQKLKKETEELI